MIKEFTLKSEAGEQGDSNFASRLITLIIKIT